MAETERITFEAGNLNEFDSLANGTDLAASVGSAMVGSYGMDFTVDGAGTTTHGSLLTSIATNVIRFRYYYNQNPLTITDGDNFFGPTLSTDSSYSGIATFGYFRFQRSGANYQVRFYAIDDGAGDQDTGWITFNKTVQHYFEVMIERETGDGNNDGTLELWIDDVSSGATSSILGNYNLFPTFDEFRLGHSSLDAGTTGNVYFDDLVIRDDNTAIGAAPAPGGISIPVVAHHLRQLGAQ